MTGEITQNSGESFSSLEGPSEAAALQAELAGLRQICIRQQIQLQETQAQLLEVLNSTWWRIGEPARLAGRRHPRLARTFRYLAWSAGKFFHYWRKGVLIERLTDYLRRKAVLARAKKKSLAELLCLNLQNKTHIDPASIKIPQSSTPVVSVIIPAYGQVDYTLRCLASIAASPPETQIEVVVVEDASGDANVDLYKKVSGIHFINRTENLGFLRSCNDAVKKTRGEFVFLLNNDTEVMPGAIDALVGLFRARPDAGLVGARLIYPDGRQQEAGGIVWRDGMAWNYGRFDDPRRPEYSYVREADYISGAAIMLLRALWDKLGGFDDYFAPAYCEDTDLAFRVRQAGLKVLYQPKAWIVHHEGISHGANMLSDLKAHQIPNGHKFATRWKDVLLQENFELGTNLVRVRDRAMEKEIILVIDHYVPEPDRDAGSRAIFQFMEVLLGMGYVVKFWPQNGHESPRYASLLQNLGIEVFYGPWSGEFKEWIQKNGYEIDKVVISRPTVAPMFLPALRKFCKAPIIFYGHDIHHARMEGEAGVTDDAAKLRSAQEMKELEQRIWLSVDHVLYLSREEAEKVCKLQPTVHVSTLPICGFAESGTPRKLPPVNPVIIFVAGFRHSPNVNAAIWFCQDILPHIRAARPDVSVMLIGSNPTAAVQALAGPGVTVTGAVSEDDLDRYYTNARVAVVPLRFGAGVKMKVVEALHKGTPLVTTEIGAQGLEGIKKAVDVTNDASGFAQAVLRLLNEDSLWIQRSTAQIDYSNKHFSIDAMRRSIEAVFAMIATQRKTAA